MPAMFLLFIVVFLCALGGVLLAWYRLRMALYVVYDIEPVYGRKDVAAITILTVLLTAGAWPFVRDALQEPAQEPQPGPPSHDLLGPAGQVQEHGRHPEFGTGVPASSAMLQR